EIELRNMLYTAQLELKNALFIRYPPGTGRILDWKQPFSKIDTGKGRMVKQGNKIAVLSVGTILNNVLDALEKIPDNSTVSVYDMRFVKPLDESLLHDVLKNHKTIITIEDGVKSGGFGSAVLEFAAQNNYKNTVYL